MIRAFHGFLGRVDDWDFLPFEHQSPDLYSLLLKTMPDAARALNREASDGDVLIGYSMGGRLVLHALVDAAASGPRYAAAVIVSAGLGVESGEERGARRLSDEEWSSRFATDDWDAVLDDWNAQTIFRGRVMRRNEAEFDREELSRAVRDWSPAAHEPLAPLLKGVDVPVLWVAGEEDPRYVEVANRAAALLPRCEVWIAPASAHRVPWEQPEMFVARVREFLKV